MRYFKLPIYALAAALITAPTVANAWWWHWDDDDDDEVELEEAFLYFELNDTDGDLGTHGKADGDAWKRMSIEGPEGPNERKILDIRAKSGLRRQGLTELFFESAEPTFDELDPEVFFPRFPEGLYEWEGKTLDGEEIEGEVYLSQIIPAAPVVTGVGGNEENPGFEIELNEENEKEVVKACWEAEPDGNGNVVISWGAVTMSHYDMWNFDLEDQPLLEGEDLRYGGEDQPERKIPLGITGSIGGPPGSEGEVAYYEFVAEIDDTEFKSTAVIPPGVNEWTIPAEFIALATDGEVKFEIIVRVMTGDHPDDDGDDVESTLGNQSAVEDCFGI